MSTDFHMNSFCTNCGNHRHRMPFGRGRSDRFFDSDPCRSCGASQYEAKYITSRSARIGGRWWSPSWGYLDRYGNVIDLKWLATAESEY